MKVVSHFLLGLLVLVQLQAVFGGSSPNALGKHKINRKAPALSPTFNINKLNRTSFPKGFIFGAAGSAYQYEGAWNLDGKGPSIWDDYTHAHPERILDHSNGDVAIDSYHRYREDIKLLKEMNADTYRFSISWPRVLPSGQISGGVNEKGIDFYNTLINHTIANGLIPSVTIFHWDSPSHLEKAYRGFLDPKIVDDYTNYANLLFERFGDRVKFWITFNEPWTFSANGYDNGFFAPGRCSAWLKFNNCTSGNSGTEPYLVAHHQLLAHAKAVQLYKTKYQAKQKGKIGITLVSQWMVPLTSSLANKRAAVRALDFMLGWFLDPIVYGRYPATMQELVGNRLPRFTEEESKSLKGSLDFLGLNYYTAFYASQSLQAVNSSQLSYSNDQRVNVNATNLKGELIGEQAGSDWLHVYPKGFYELLVYVKNKYKNPIIYITENGVDEINNATLPLQDALKDNFRISYYFRHLDYLHKAILDGVRVRGYYGWSLLDNFEWASGYTVRFGINFVDYTNLNRHRKLSSYWFENFLKK